MPDMFSIGCTRDFNSYPLQVVDGIELQGLVDHEVNEDCSDLENISIPLTIEDGNHSFFGEDCLQYLSSNVSLLSQSLGTSSPDELETIVTSLLVKPSQSASAHKRSNMRWNTLVYVLRWRFSIKRILASTKENRIPELSFD